MTRAGLLLASIGLAMAGVSPPQASWRAEGLSSFDVVWQTIADTYYDPTFAGVDWNLARRELRPKAEAASSADGIRRVIGELLARVNRSHFLLLSAADAGSLGPVGEATVPIDVRIAAEGVVIVRVERPSPEGLAPGQILVAVDGSAVVDWRATGADPADRRRAVDLWRRVYRLLRGRDGSIATLTVRSAGRADRVVEIARARERGDEVTLGNLAPMAVRAEARELRSPAGRRVGLIGFNVWMTPIDAPVAAAVDRFRDADGVILDLRGNPGGLAAMMSGIAGHFIADPDARLGRMQTREAQLEFRPNPRLATADGRRVTPFAGPLAILVDELTGSTSECFAGALRDLGRARVFGRETMGEALPALTKRLPNGDVLMHAVGNFVTSTGRPLEGSGVGPDQVVPLSLVALAQGRDLAVEAALAWFDR